MATLAELKTARDQLLRQRHSGVARVTFGAKTVQYRDDSEIAAALHDLERSIAAEEGTRPVRQIRTYATKGT